MDTLETNIKMCEKAEKIQENWVASAHDTVWLKSGEYYVCQWKRTGWHFKKEKSGFSQPIIFTCPATSDKGSRFIGYEDWKAIQYVGVAWADKSDCIWLPRQDQLQEMVLSSERYQTDSRWIDLIIDVTIFSQEYREADSMEQLWLAFVMKELYQKHWNGTDWVKEKGV